jgi:hypothetical protein
VHTTNEKSSPCTTRSEPSDALWAVVTSAQVAGARPRRTKFRSSRKSCGAYSLVWWRLTRRYSTASWTSGYSTRNTSKIVRCTPLNTCIAVSPTAPATP